MAITRIPFTFIHPYIDRDDLNANGKFLSDEALQRVREALKILPDGRYRKARFNKLGRQLTREEAEKLINKKAELQAKLEQKEISPKERTEISLELRKNKYKWDENGIEAFPYGITKLKDKIYIVYKGARFHKDIYTVDASEFKRKIKLAQDAETGEMLAMKSSVHPIEVQIQMLENEIGNVYIKKDVAEGKLKHLRAEHANLQDEARGYVFYRMTRLNNFAGYFFMRLIPGEDLYHFTDKKLKLADLRWVSIAIQMMEEVQKFHDQGLIIRDIKLNNTMYDPSMHKIKLIDLEEMKQKDAKGEVATELVKGTVLYMAPEIFKLIKERGECVSTAATDVFALGESLKVMFHIPILWKKATWETTPIKNKYYMHGSQKLPPATINLLRPILDSMTDNEPAKRNLPAAIEAIKEIYQAMLKTETLKIAILDVAELLKFHQFTLNNLEPTTKVNILIENFSYVLKQFDEVQFISKTAVSIPDQAKIQELMREIKMVFRNGLLIVSNISLLTEIPEMIEAEDPALKFNFTYFDLYTSETEKLIKEPDFKFCLISHGINFIHYNKTVNFKDAIQIRHQHWDQTREALKPVKAEQYAEKITLIENEIKRLTNKKMAKLFQVHNDIVSDILQDGTDESIDREPQKLTERTVKLEVSEAGVVEINGIPPIKKGEVNNERKQNALIQNEIYKENQEVYAFYQKLKILETLKEKGRLSIQIFNELIRSLPPIPAAKPAASYNFGLFTNPIPADVPKMNGFHHEGNHQTLSLKKGSQHSS